MAVFEVYTKIDEQGSENEPNQLLHLVKTTASLMALFFPLIWLLWHRLWFYFAVYLLLSFLMFGLGTTKYNVFLPAIYFLPNLYLYFEGPNLVAKKFLENGFRLSNIVSADSYNDAEIKWYTHFYSTNKNDLPDHSVKSVKPIIPIQIQDRPEFGLFAEE